MTLSYLQKKFIEEEILEYRVMKFLEEELNNNDVASIDIQRTPLLTRITIEVRNPSKLVGRKGTSINKIASRLENELGIKNPQISVVEVKNAFLEPRIVGRRAAKMIELGKKPRAIIHQLLEEIMKNGAVGAEIIIGGAMSRGTRAKSMGAMAGFVPKAGDATKLVKKAHVSAVTKFGVIGIKVKIVPPGTIIPGTKLAKELEKQKLTSSSDGEKNA